jgi:hypothetical protein
VAAASLFESFAVAGGALSVVALMTFIAGGPAPVPGGVVGERVESTSAPGTDWYAGERPSGRAGHDRPRHDRPASPLVDFSGRREPGAAGLAGPSRAAPSRAAPGARRPQQPGIRGSAADDGPEPNSPADAPRQAHPEAAEAADEAEQATQGHADRQTHHVAQPCVHLASVGWQQPSRDVLGTSDR